MKFGVVVFPGTNCDLDTKWAVENVGVEVEMLWHRQGSFEVDAVILPGGFSYGDYLRAGAIAKFSPLMKEVIRFANKGGLVLGICNGFQVLVESGLLPGAFLHNDVGHFVCRPQHLVVSSSDSPFTMLYDEGEVVVMPIAHGEGNYYLPPDELKKVQDEERIVFQYSSENGEISDEFNPNGSTLSIAGILSEGRNVLGMMPHPERASDEILGSADGVRVFEGMKKYIESMV